MRWFERQLRQPTGFAGRWILGRMRRNNATLNRAAVEALEIGDAHHVLEAGYGPGDALAAILEQHPGCRLTGVDHAPLAADDVRRRLGGAVRDGHLELWHADLAALPCPDASFDRVLTVQTVYFWTDPRAVLDELHRVLRPDGRVVIAFVDKPRPTTGHDFTPRTTAEICEWSTPDRWSTHCHTVPLARGTGELVVLDRR